MNERQEVNISYLLENNNYSNIKQIIELLSVLKSKNIKTITIDDDPNISNDIYLKVLKYLKYANLNLELKNNGTDLSKRNDILYYFDTVRLQIDSNNEEILDKMCNNKEQYKINMNNYNYLKSCFKDISIGIDTYFTKLNFRNLGDMYTLIKGLDIDNWNILYTNDIKIKDEYLLSKEMIDTIIEFYNSTELSDKLNRVTKDESKMKIKRNKKLPYTLLTIY